MLMIAIIHAVLILTSTGDAKSTPNDDTLREKLVHLQRRHVNWLLDHPDVTAVDVNHKTVGGKQTDQLSLVLWVKKKLPESEIPHHRRLPKEIEGFHTDVIEGEMARTLEGGTTQIFEGHVAESNWDSGTKDYNITCVCVCPSSPCPPQPPCPPLPPTTTCERQTCPATVTQCPPCPTMTCRTPTMSCTPCPTVQTPLSTIPMPTPTPTPEVCPCRKDLSGLKGGDCLQIKGEAGFGTLGYFTKRNSNVGILSNFHVTRSPPNRVTTRNIPFPMDFVGTIGTVAFNKIVDASHSDLCEDPPPQFQLTDGTVIQGTREARCGDLVRFCGCSTGCSRIGMVHSVNWCGDVGDDRLGVFRFCNQIIFTPPSIPGDSGSVLINAVNNKATGLVFASVGTVYGIANPIGDVLEDLGITLAVP